MAADTQAPEWATGMVLDALNDAKAEGRDVVFRAAIQEAVGIGTDDLDSTLSELVAEGKIVEEAPGEYRLPYEDEERGEAVEVAYEPAAEDDEREHSLPVNGREPPPPTGAVSTQLTAGMAKQLAPEALGQLVQAGIEDAKGRAFILTITP